jgi:hypothetical protein
MPTPSTTAVAEHRECPLCDSPLDAARPDECPRCDWTSGYRRRKSTPIGGSRDIAAILLSVIPGLGHIYKGHIGKGVLLMAGGALAIFASGVAATATMGLGLLFIPVYWIAVMLQVFWLEDLRRPAR